MSLDLLLGHTTRSYARGDLGPSRAAESTGLLALLALALAPRVGRAIEATSYRASYRRGSHPTVEVPVVPMRRMVPQRRSDVDIEPRMYRGDMRVTREMPAVEVDERVARVYGRRRA